MNWQLQDAKSRLSEMVRRTLEEGPQTITRHGEAVVVMVPVEEFRRLGEHKPDFKEFLTNAPDFGRLDIRRKGDPSREVRFEAS